MSRLHIHEIYSNYFTNIPKILKVNNTTKKLLNYEIYILSTYLSRYRKCT